MDTLLNIFDVGSWLNQLMGLSPWMIMWLFFIRGGWIFIAITAIRFAWWYRINLLQSKFVKKFDYVMYAIDIPKDSEQSPKAMEQVFATISGAHSPLSVKEKVKEGAIQLQFSFEIVSIDGYIQFLVRTARVYSDLVLGSIYAHYPDAEITEVEDYTTAFESKFPNDRYNVWGSEIELAAPDPVPIRTYRSFEDLLAQELKDPLSGLLETMSRIQKGEQVWFQIIVLPTDNAWVKRSIAYAMKIAGKKAPGEGKKSWYTSWLDILYHMFDDWISWIPGAQFDPKKENGNDFRVMNLTPGERATVEAIEQKASKIGFVCKIRLVYLAPHESFSSRRVVSSVFGAIKQFGDLSLNAFKPNKRTKTQISYFNWFGRLEARRRRIVSNYKLRSWFLGSRSFILNTEELATIYHFPSLLVKTSALKRTETKKSDAPSQIPMGALDTLEPGESDLREQLIGLRYDNTHYERLYGKRIVKPPTTGVRVSFSEPKRSPGGSDDGSVPSNLPIT